MQMDKIKYSAMLVHS
jgi:hypothetical protein